MRTLLFLLLPVLCLLPCTGNAQDQGPLERFYSFEVDHAISVLEEKHLIQLAVNMDPYAKVLLDDGRQLFVVRTMSALKTAEFTRAAQAHGMVVKRRLEETNEHQPTSFEGQ
jgi:hypothetical protein